MFSAARLVGVLTVSLLLGSGAALAEKSYGPGASDGEIKIGQTMPYSGPGSSYGTIGKTEPYHRAGFVPTHPGILEERVNSHALWR